MDDSCSEGVATIVGVIIVMIIIFAANFYLDRVACFSKSADMGFNANYSYFGGCRIEVEDNKWIPLESYYFKEE